MVKPEVLIVKLNDKTRFEDYVQLLNLAKKYALKRYAHAGDSFYYFGLEKPIIDSHKLEVVAGWRCGFIATEYIAPEPKFLTIVISWFQKAFSEVDTYWVATYLSLIVCPSVVYILKLQNNSK